MPPDAGSVDTGPSIDDHGHARRENGRSAQRSERRSRRCGSRGGELPIAVSGVLRVPLTSRLSGGTATVGGQPATRPAAILTLRAPDQAPPVMITAMISRGDPRSRACARARDRNVVGVVPAPLATGSLGREPPRARRAGGSHSLRGRGLVAGQQAARRRDLGGACEPRLSHRQPACGVGRARGTLRACALDCCGARGHVPLGVSASPPKEAALSFSTDVPIGSELLGFRIERLLGRGGMGVV